MLHEPSDYVCPFCTHLEGLENERNCRDDIVAREELAFARIAPKWWPANPGSLLVIPTAHYENLYEIPDEVGAAIWSLTRRVATALKLAYGCDGVSTRQHNEPAGNQDVWHLHVHVFPRYAGDQLYLRHDEARWVSPEERTPYARRLRHALGSH